MDEKVAAPIALGEYRCEERCLVRGEVAVFTIGDMWCPDRHELAETQFVREISVPEADLDT
jgi:hypothetical protein